MKNTVSYFDCTYCFKDKRTIFSVLTPDEITLINSEKSCNSYKKGAVIFFEGNRTHSFYCVNSGIIKMFKTGAEGKEQIVNFAKPGDIIGYRSIFNHEPACTTAKAIEDVSLCEIPGDILIELVKNNGKFAIELMQLACKELGEANRYLTEIAQKTVRERLAETLIKLNESFSTDTAGYLKISLTREELASLVGTATESVIRLLSEFKADNLIEIAGRKIKIINEQKLRKISSYY